MNNQDDKKAFACANYILDKLNKYKIQDVTNLKLQKLLYFAYGINLVLYDKKLFESQIHAYKLGPVVPDVYREFKNHGNGVITTRAYYEEEGGELGIITYNELQDGEIKSIDIACSAQGSTKAWDLVDITHRQNSAWSRVYNKDAKHIEIPDKYIKEEFEQYIDTLAKYLLQ